MGKCGIHENIYFVSLVNLNNLAMPQSKRTDIENIPYGVIIEFDTIRYFVDNSHVLYEQWKDGLRTRVRENEQDLDADQNRLWNLFYDDRLNKADKISTGFHASSFVSAVAATESLFSSICLIVQDPDHIVGKSERQIYLKDSRKFLAKDIGIDLSNLQNDWNELAFYAQVRNKIAHERSSAKKVVSNNSFITRLRTTNYVRIDRDTETKVYFSITEPEFVLNYCTIAERFLNNVIAKVRTHIAQEGTGDQDSMLIY